jgi:hypothetical protein
MADEATGLPETPGVDQSGAGTPSPAPTPAAPPTPDPATERIGSLERQLADLDSRNRQYEAALTSMVQAQAGQTQAMPTVVSPAARQFLRQRGLSDQEIDANAAIIGPFLDYAAQAAVAPLVQQNQTLQHAIDGIKAKSEFEHWDLVSADAERIRTEAAQRGQYLSMEDAYDKAVVRNFDKVADARNAQRHAATRRAQDASAYGTLGGSRAVMTGGERGPVTRERLAAMSREERSKLWDELEKG